MKKGKRRSYEVVADESSEQNVTARVYRPTLMFADDRGKRVPPTAGSDKMLEQSESSFCPEEAAFQTAFTTPYSCLPPTGWCLITVLSALYGKLLLVVGIGFVTSEILTARIPLHFYEGYFTFLYGVSLIFLGVSTSCLIRNGDGFDFSLRRSRAPATEPKEGGSCLEEPATTATLPGSTNGNGTGSNGRRRRASFIMEAGTGFGSLFFRLGVLAFGLAAMVYCGLEFGSFFEIPPHSPCYRILRGINPILRMAFTFAQMYFIFMASRPAVAKFHVWTKFGLMHLVATNLSVWIKTLVHESTQEFSLRLQDDYLMELSSYEDIDGGADLNLATALPTVALEFNKTCQRQEIMGSVVTSSAPYLCPFLVQFSLIGAAVSYVMWRSVGRPWELAACCGGLDGRLRLPLPRRVDCVGASRGLFLGLFLLVTNVICLILFFVLVAHPRFQRLAIYLAHLSHAVVMLVSLVAITVGMLQVRPLSSGGGGHGGGDSSSGTSDVDRPLSKLLLHVATFGTFLYGTFGILAGAMTGGAGGRGDEPGLLLAATSALTVVQVAVQSLFLLQVSGGRQSIAPRAAAALMSSSARPGSQAVTLLLISNVTLWIVATFEIRHGLVNPVQSEFYGASVWAVIQAVTLPLCIFYRFQSAVMLASLWKITCLSPTK